MLFDALFVGGSSNALRCAYSSCQQQRVCLPPHKHSLWAWRRVTTSDVIVLHLSWALVRGTTTTGFFYSLLLLFFSFIKETLLDCYNILLYTLPIILQDDIQKVIQDSQLSLCHPLFKSDNSKHQHHHNGRRRRSQQEGSQHPSPRHPEGRASMLSLPNLVSCESQRTETDSLTKQTEEPQQPPQQAR